MNEKIRLDTWLWYARFYKSRTLSSKAISSGHLRVNSTKVTKPASKIQIDDVLTINYGNGVRLIQVKNLGYRRGPASEAQELYFDKSTKETTSFDLNSVSKKVIKAQIKGQQKKTEEYLIK